MSDISLLPFKHFVTNVCFFLVSCFMLANCESRESIDYKLIEETLRNADASIDNAVSRKNVDSLMIFYAEGASLLPTAEPIVKGKASIRKEWEHIFQIPDFSNKSTLTDIVISKDADMAYTMGHYLASMMGEDGKPVEEPGKWLTIWRKQSDGQWRIVIEMYNTDIPPPDHK